MQILGYKFMVDMSATEDEIGASGRMHADKGLIQIANTLNDEQKKSTAIHEIIEATNYLLDLGLTHQQICGIEAGIYSALASVGGSIGGFLREAKL